MQLKREKEAQEKEAQLKREQELKLQQEKEAKLKREKEAKLQQEKEAKLQQEKEAKLKREQELKLQREQEKEAKLKRELKLQQEKEAKLQQEKEAKLQREQELKLQREQEKEAKLKREQELKLQREQELKLQREQEKEAKLKRELKLQREQEKEAKLKREQELKLKREQELKLQREQELKLQREQEKEAKLKRELKLQQEKEAKLQREQELKLQREQEKEAKLQREPELFNLLNKIKIINVYQNTYAKGVQATGIGDFIRGSFFLMQFCSDVGYAYEIDISNHYMSKFLENSPQNINSINNNYTYYDDTITKCTGILNNKYKISPGNVINNSTGNKQQIITKFKTYLNAVPINNKTMKVYTITFPYKQLPDVDRQKMRVIMEPTNIIISGGKNILNYLGLYGKTYTCIHIRLGDSYINDSSYNEDNNKKIKKIQKILGPLNKETQYLLISDNNSIKPIISNLQPNVRGFEHDISHTGEGSILTDTNMKNTMIDFYLLSQATTILSLTIYKHGSGFSKWCAEIYNIPYTCFLI